MTETGGINRIRFSWFASGLIAALTCLLIQTGCDEYRIAMRARGDLLERTVSLWIGDEPKKFGEELAARLARAYGEKVDEDASAVTSAFSGTMPQDVGGAGAYTRFLSPFGSSHVYMERFRGTDDVTAPIEQTNGHITRITEFIAGWLEAELGGDPDGPVLGRFVRERIRADLENLNFYFVASRLDEKTILARMFQYLVEREYFSIAEIPGMAREIDDDDEQFMMVYAARLAARQLGGSRADPIPEKLRFLTDPDYVEASLHTYARGTPEFRQWVAEHPDVEQSEQYQEWLDDELDPIFANFLSRLFSKESSLRVSLELAAPPASTNGDWNEEASRVEWAFRELPDEGELTAFVYAIWAEPASEYQQARFGRVILEGHALFKYVFSYASLTEAESEEWDAFIEELVPGEHLLASIRGFRFADESLDPEAPAENPPKSRAAPIITVVTDAIKPANP